MEWQKYEESARVAISDHFGVDLQDIGLNIDGKTKRLDLVNTVAKYAGDVKFYKNTAGGNIPSAKRSTMNEYVWILQKLPDDWTKFIVIGEDYEMASKYVNDFEPWLRDVDILYFERPDKIISLRNAGRQ